MTKTAVATLNDIYREIKLVKERVVKIEHYVIHHPMDEFEPDDQQKKALSKARDNFKKGKTLSYEQFAKALGS